MTSTRNIVSSKGALRFFLFIAVLFSSFESTAQQDSTRSQLVMRFYDFGFINFERKTPERKNWYYTESFLFQYTPRFGPSGDNLYTLGMRFGGEKHNPFRKRLSYYMGSSIGLGVSMDRQFGSSTFDINLFGDVGYKLGLNFHFGERFALGVEGAVFYRLSLPLNDNDDIDDFEIEAAFDADWLTFTAVFKLKD